MSTETQDTRRATPIKPGLDVSFEFFPPKTPAMEQTLWRSIERLTCVGPRFVSVTYGAGGTTRERTHATVKRVLQETPLTPAAHLTCVDATREQVDEVARRYHDIGVRHIVALRGDPPDGDRAFSPHPEGYRNAAELVAGLTRIADFDVSVGAYPEVHPDASSPESDLDNLKRKLEILQNEVSREYPIDGIVGESPAFRRALNEAQQAAKSDATVMVIHHRKWPRIFGPRR